MKLLVLEDDSLFRKAISTYLGNHFLEFAGSVEDAFALLDKSEIDGAIIDLHLGAGKRSGKDFLAEFKKRFPEKPVLVQSSAKDTATVVSCMKLGADDYIEKPFDAETLQLKVDKIFADSRRTRVLKREYEKSAPEIIGKSPVLLAARKLVEKAGSLRILLLGETGVGKTPFAKYSNRVVAGNDARPFEHVNCSSLQADQLIDTLFGHKKGAFTGAVGDKRGLVELADNGDLFLDEIGEMPLAVQSQLLTFMDTMEYYRLGDDTKRKANVRIISATNRDLKRMVEAKLFRKDLYSRISQVIVQIPPLRERIDDLPLLFHHFLEKFSFAGKTIDPAIIEILSGYRWEEGNVREFRDLVEYMCAVSRDSDRLEVLHIDSRYRPVVSDEREVEKIVDSIFGKEGLQQVYELGFEAFVEHLERELFRKLHAENPPCPEAMAARLKISKATYYRWVKKFGLSTNADKLSLLEAADAHARQAS